MAKKSYLTIICFVLFCIELVAILKAQELRQIQVCVCHQQRLNSTHVHTGTPASHFRRFPKRHAPSNSPASLLLLAAALLAASC